jgi:leucyl-tRNA synthetase
VYSYSKAEIRLKLHDGITHVKDKPVLDGIPLDCKFDIEKQTSEEYFADSWYQSSFSTVLGPIAHYLQCGVPVPYNDMGVHGSVYRIQPQSLTGEVWDYIFLGKGLPPNYFENRLALPSFVLDTLQKSFLYWYPSDDNIVPLDFARSHFCYNLYSHSAIFGGVGKTMVNNCSSEDLTVSGGLSDLQFLSQQDKYPKQVTITPRLLLNSDKTHVESPCFKTLREIIDMYGSDVARLAMIGYFILNVYGFSLYRS